MRKPRKNSTESLAFRVSVSLSAEQHEFLARLARRKRVSLAWVVRDAVERLLADEIPLFKRKQVKEESV